MSRHDEFRQEVRCFLSEIEDRGREGGRAFDHPPRDAENSERAATWTREVVITLCFFLQDGYQILDTVPVSPRRLREIRDEIFKIPLIEKWRRAEKLTWWDCDHGLPVLANRLREMLEQIPPANSSQLSAPKEPQKGALLAKERPPSKRRARRVKARKNLSPSERRADTVAKIIEELNILKPEMTGVSYDYERLAKKHHRFLTFRVARMYSKIQTAVEAVQARRGLIGLAQEIVAANSGVSLETVKRDWKKHKPQKFRQRNK